MIDERLEELASLYAFDLLEGAELAQFEAALARDAELQALVRELRQTAADLARTAPAVPPPAALKQRVLASLSTSSRAPGRDNVVRPPAALWRAAPWAAAACFALVAAWLGQRVFTRDTELAAWRNRQELTEVNQRITQQQLDAERLLNERKFDELSRVQSDAARQLTDARTQLTDRDRQLAEARSQLAERERLLTESRTQLADARSQLTERDRQVATLSQRVVALASSSTEIGQQLDAAKQQITQLTAELKSQGALADLKITALASMLKNSPQALAIAVWDPKKQEGVLNVQHLPALAANEDYQLWVVDPQYPNPVDGGVFTVDRSTGVAKVSFKPKRPITAINAYAVTKERKGGVEKSAGPFLLLGK